MRAGHRSSASLVTLCTRLSEAEVWCADAVCYSGELLMRNFGFPYEIDRLVMRQAYPWLETYVQPGC